jgi:hypothetical protein
MKKTATDVMEEILFSAVLDAIAALKAASKGMPNTLLRDLNAVHPNTTFADLPKELQAAMSASVRTAFVRLQKEGYTVSSGAPVPQRPTMAPRSGDGRPGDGPPRGGPRGPRPPRGPRR